MDRELADADLDTQAAALEQVLRASPCVGPLLGPGPHRELPGWYVGAGAVAQTVWNATHGFAPNHGVKDVDLVYFDPDDLSAEAEERVEQAVRRAFPGLGVDLDVTNEARVHLWYERRLGVPLRPYRSSEEAIATWPATATSIGVRTGADRLVVCAPYGLRDLFALVVRPNKTLVTEAVYTAKATRWRSIWPLLRIIGW
jgi:hypothetical protein